MARADATTTIAVCRATRNLYLGKESAGYENGIDGFDEGGRKRVYSSCAPADPRLMPLRAKAVEACRFVFFTLAPTRKRTRFECQADGRRERRVWPHSPLKTFWSALDGSDIIDCKANGTKQLHSRFGYCVVAVVEGSERERGVFDDDDDERERTKNEIPG